MSLPSSTDQSQTAAALMDKAQLKQWILRRLGAPAWKVELTDDHLDDAVETAQRWFSAKKGVKRQISLAYYPGVSAYELPNNVDIVLDVAFPGSPMELAEIYSPFGWPGGIIPLDLIGGGALGAGAGASSGGTYSMFTQTLQTFSVAKRMLNAEADWLQQGRMLLIFPVPCSAGMLMIDYKSHAFTLEQLSERDHDLVKRYALAQAKLDLGRMRGKYGEFPGAQGSTRLDGDKLLSEGQSESQALTEELAMSAYPMDFLAG